MGCSTYLSNKLLDHVYGKTPFEADDDLELAFYSTPPNSDGSGGTELPNTGGYERAPIVNDTTTFPAASARQKLNGVVFDFANDGSAGDWIAAVAFKIFDSSGNVYDSGLINPPIIVRAFKTHRVKLGALMHNLT